ncbi:MAG: PhoH family protein [Deltaproteobacteria bacterium]|jgi:phosphate starvation-inducible PhoH-like protein|nr:PhoH family protein [Deltaproteobacteria bacterium]
MARPNLVPVNNGEVVSRRSRLGPGSRNLKILAERLGFTVGQRGEELLFLDEDPVKRALSQKALAALERLPIAGAAPSAWEVECLATLLSQDPDIDVNDFFQGTRLQLEGVAIVPRTLGQRAYLEAISRSDLVFGLGPAGTGKTYLAVAAALAALAQGEVSRLILTRPAVEAGEKLGFLPGDLTEKIDPYLRPLYDALSELVPGGYYRLWEKGRLEVAPLAFMRGRTLSGAFVILDEAQNTTPAQMKMFLTRLGPGSKAVVTGDPGQSDLPDGRERGLVEAMEILPSVKGVSFCHLKESDVVRHPLVRAILEAYERRGKVPAAPRDKFPGELEPNL